MERTTYRLYRMTEQCDSEEFAHTTSPRLAALILRMCRRQAKGHTLYEVQPALPAHVVDDTAPASLSVLSGANPRALEESVNHGIPNTARME